MVLFVKVGALLALAMISLALPTSPVDTLQGPTLEKRYKIAVNCKLMCTEGSVGYNEQACVTVCGRRARDRNDTQEWLSHKQRLALMHAYFPNWDDSKAKNGQWLANHLQYYLPELLDAKVMDDPERWQLSKSRGKPPPQGPGGYRRQ